MYQISFSLSYQGYTFHLKQSQNKTLHKLNVSKIRGDRVWNYSNSESESGWPTTILVCIMPRMLLFVNDSINCLFIFDLWFFCIISVYHNLVHLHSEFYISELVVYHHSFFELLPVATSLCSTWCNHRLCY